MNLRLQQIRNALRGSESFPRIYNFSDYYETNHGIRPEKNKITMPEEKIASKSSSVVANPAFGNNKNLAIIGVSFLGSSVLTILAHATNILDKFGEPVKKFSRFGVTFLSLVLGTIAGAGIINSNSYK